MPLQIWYTTRKQRQHETINNTSKKTLKPGCFQAMLKALLKETVTKQTLVLINLSFLKL